MSGWKSAFVGILVVAAITHVVALWAVPRIIMSRAMAGLDAAGAHNRALHPPRPTDRSRSIVLPSPDLLYTTCSFDLASGPLHISAPVPATYWSVAFFADNTDNFFVLDDRMAGGSADVLLVAPGDRSTAPAGMRRVEAPAQRGIVLFRTLIDREEDLPTLQVAQRQQNCVPLASR